MVYIIGSKYPPWITIVTQYPKCVRLHTGSMYYVLTSYSQNYKLRQHAQNPRPRKYQRGGWPRSILFMSIIHTISTIQNGCKTDNYTRQHGDLICDLRQLVMVSIQLYDSLQSIHCSMKSTPCCRGYVKLSLISFSIPY